LKGSMQIDKLSINIPPFLNIRSSLEFSLYLFIISLLNFQENFQKKKFQEN
jgi:hypothetical protein